MTVGLIYAVPCMITLSRRRQLQLRMHIWHCRLHAYIYGARGIMHMIMSH